MPPKNIPTKVEIRPTKFIKELAASNRRFATKLGIIERRAVLKNIPNKKTANVTK
jgi:hypothetical protein